MEILLAMILGVGVLCLGLLNSISRNLNDIKNELCNSKEESKI